MFTSATTHDLEALLSDLYAHSVELPANVRLIAEIENELVARDLDQKAKQDLEEAVLGLNYY